MLFNSFAFILAFLPFSVLVYWVLRRAGWIAASNTSLLILSLCFYFSGEKNYTFLIFISVTFNYLIGGLIARRRDYSQRLVCLGLSANLLGLAYLKYANFLVSNLAAVFPGIPVGGHVELPIGISFFTFTQIAFLVDCYRSKATEYNANNYALFVTFYPHLVAGPILHHSEMMPQFARRDLRSVADNLVAGIGMFAIGLFKKTVIADSVAITVTEQFSGAATGQLQSFLPAWVCALSYAVQIYFDFSGYSDMAIGISRMFGIDLPINFNSPYKATSIADFWRRWHITLSRFLRDYLYIPLGGGRSGRFRTYVNLTLTMLLGGLWHGANWTFLVWGLIHGLWLAAERLVSQVYGSTRAASTLAAVFGRFFTLGVVLFAWIPFRAPDMATALRIWKGMLGLHGLILPPEWPLMPAFISLFEIRAGRLDLHPVDVIVVLLAMAIAMCLPNSQQIMSRFSMGLQSPGYPSTLAPPDRWIASQNWVWAAIFGLMLGVAMVYMGGYSEFIYFQF